MKCRVCGKEVNLPFQCTYCQDYFCNNHRLPENHQCPNLSKEKFWYQKEKIAQKEVPTLKERTVRAHKPQFEGRTKKKRMKKIVYGIIFLVAIIAIGFLVYTNFPFFIRTEVSNPQVNMREKIKNELSFDGSILDYDWNVWSKVARDSGMIFTKMDSWEQFKESHKQGLPTITMMIDQQNRVVWYKAYINHVIYYEY